jgi:hypothetical protein
LIGKAIKALKSEPAITSRALFRFNMIEVFSMAFPERTINRTMPVSRINFCST